MSIRGPQCGAFEAFTKGCAVADDVCAEHGVTHRTLRDRVVNALVQAARARGIEFVTRELADNIMREQAKWLANEIDAWFDARTRGVPDAS